MYLRDAFTVNSHAVPTWCSARGVTYAEVVKTAKHLLAVCLTAILALAADTGRAPGPRALANVLRATDTPEADAWVAAQLAAMSPEERIGQLFVARVHSDGSAGSLEAATKLVAERHIGGVCFFQGTPEAQVEWTNALQAASAKTPLLVAMDAEWGVAMRFAGQVRRLPYNVTLGAADDLGLTREIGRETGRQLQRLGVHVSFAPVVDLNSDPANPVIGKRSFGEEPTRVGKLGMAYARGLADAGVLAVAKHFPGHGDTGVDSHVDLPVLDKSAEQLDTLEMVPFRMMAQDKVAGIMTGHLAVPRMDGRPNRPASLSAEVTRDVLRKRWKYQGLVVTDGLDMAGVTKHFSDAEIAVEAVRAGNDLLLIPSNIPAGIAALRRAVNTGELTQARVDASVERILRAKYAAGLAEYAPTPETGVKADLDLPAIDALSERVYRKAVTVVRAADSLPIVDVAEGRTAVVSLGAERLTEWQRAAARYAPVSQPVLGKRLSAADVDKWTESLAAYDRVLLGLHDLNWDRGANYGLTPEALRLLRGLRGKTKVTLVAFGCPYVIGALAGLGDLIVAYEDTPLAQKAAAEVVYGAIGASGTLPVSAGRFFPPGTGLVTSPVYRLVYSQAANAGFSESKLRELDRLMNQAIADRATPGGVVLAAHDGQVGYLKAFGTFTYDKGADRVDVSTVYDLASITKVAATTIAVMRLHEQGKISVYDPIGEHLPWLANTNKARLRILDIVAHQARLQAWIPFYQKTIVEEKGAPRAFVPGLYSTRSKAGTSTPVTDELFILDSYRDTMLAEIANSDLLPGAGYKYSDLGFYIMAELVQHKTGVPLDAYVEREFYRPMGLRSVGFRPMERMASAFVPPTEEDDYWRSARVQGYVHDMGSAMLGGVSGHAGLFSNATDLAAIGQMMLFDGFYGGRRYFTPETVRLFTTRHPKSTRRGLGWDMAELSSRGSSNVSALASARTFGHLGFTGTAMWADPETGILFLVLANRTYPRMSRNLWHKDRYRPRLQEAVYQALE